MKIDLFYLQIAGFEFLKMFIPVMIVFIVMKIKHNKFVKRVAKSVYQEKLFCDTDYSDFIQKV